jgi:hypothetical protein
MSEFFVPDGYKYDVPDQEGCFVVPETTIIQRPGITWAFARGDDVIVYERTPSPPLLRASETRSFERAPEQLEFQGGAP